MSRGILLQTTQPWWHVGKRQHGGTPFGSLALEWCGRCRSEVDSDTEATDDGSTYVYKRTCCRCGTVLKWGVMHAPTVGNRDRRAAMRWVSTPEQDRR